MQTERRMTPYDSSKQAVGAVDVPARPRIEKKKFAFLNLSIKRRLPLLIGTLLLGSVTALTLASYSAVKQSALEVGNQRLLNLSQQLASLTQQSGPLLLSKTSAAANDQAIRAYLESPSSSTHAADAVLATFGVEQDPATLQVELWNGQSSLVLVNPPGELHPLADLEAEFNQTNGDPFKTLGPMRQIKDVVAYPVVATARDEGGKVIGHLVRWRKVSTTPAARKQLTDLLGSEAVVLFGNARGDIWTDLDKVVSKPPITLNSDVAHFTRDGQSFMAVGRPISGTPWFVVVEFPEQPFLTEAHRFLRRILLVDLVVLLLGITAALTLSRNITRPLHTLTEAAGAISNGEYQEVAVQRNDELGALADAFSVMSLKVRASQSELETKVEALCESEQRLQTVIESLSEGLVVADLEGQLLHWNRAAMEIHGFKSVDECLLKLPEFANIFELSDLDGNVLDLNEWPLPRVIRGERLRNLEIRLRRLNSDWMRVFSYGGAIVTEKSGRLVAVVTMNDITDRKRAEDDRRLLADIVESSEDAIIGEDLNGNVISWNKGAEELYGYTAAEAMGHSIWLRVPPERADEAQESLERRRRGERIDRFSTERVTKDGQRIRVSVSISPIRDSAGRLVGTSTIARNITDQVRAEEERVVSEIRYRRLFESAKDGILILDAHTGQIIEVNPFLCELLGYASKQLRGKKLWEIGSLKDVVASKSAYAKLQQQGYVRYEDLPLETSSGDIRQVEFVSNSYLAGETLVFQCNIRDITERKMAEKALKETNQRLEQTLVQLKGKTSDLAGMTQQLWQASKLATMGELAASIAHELNNPLATISLRIDSLATELANDERRSRTVEIIAGEVERMGKLIGSLLQFSRRSHQQVSTLDIVEEIEKSLELIQYHLRARRVEVVREFDEILPTLQADRQQLRQVFLNLLTNASDAMPQGGKLIIRVTSVERKPGAKFVSVELNDSGPGIPPADLEKIWEPFFTTKPEGKGTGLGLAISRRAIEAHQGTISIKSQAGEGTTVTILLPATNGKVEQLTSELAESERVLEPR